MCLHICNDIITILSFPQPAELHLCAGHKVGGGPEEGVECGIIPSQKRILHCGAIIIPLGDPRGVAHNTTNIWPNTMPLKLGEGMAMTAELLKEFLPAAWVPHRCLPDIGVFAII